MSKPTQSLVAIVARVTSAIAGIQKNLPALTQIPLAGVVYSSTTLVAALQAYVPLVSALQAAHNQLHAAVLAERVQRKQVLSILYALAAYVTNLYGADPAKVGDFGFTLRKPLGVETAATRAKSAAEASATRARKKAAVEAATPAPAPAPATSTTK